MKIALIDYFHFIKLGADFQVLNFGKSLAKVCPDLQKKIFYRF
jgi:hypothetical protein